MEKTWQVRPSFDEVGTDEMDTAFFVASKLGGALLRVDSWIVILTGLILLFMWRGAYARARILGSILFGGLVLLSAFPLGDMVLAPIEHSVPADPLPKHVDGIIVLGGGGAGRPGGYLELNEGGDRYTAAVALSRRFPEAKVLFSGGSGALRDLVMSRATEASGAEQFFLDLGIAQDRLIIESASRNTAENARLSWQMAQPSASETWVLVTSAFHMPRAIRSFETVGWTKVIAYPVDYRTAPFRDGAGWDMARNLSVLNTAIREWVGQTVYHLSGR